jgi:hypothetical protein
MSIVSVLLNAGLCKNWSFISEREITAVDDKIARADEVVNKVRRKSHSISLVT